MTIDLDTWSLRQAAGSCEEAEAEERLSGQRAAKRQRQRERRASRTAEQRAERLLRQRAQQLRVTERRATESATGTEARLARRRVRDRARRASDSDGTPVFGNCGAVNSTGYLLSPQKRERPIFNNYRGLLRSRHRRERGSSSASAGLSAAEECFRVDRRERGLSLASAGLSAVSSSGVLKCLQMGITYDS